LSARKQRRALQEWHDTTRAIAHDAARALAIQIASGQDVGIQVYDIGFVLEEGEVVWHRAPTRFQTMGELGWVDRGTVEWAITSEQLVGRRPDGGLEFIAWRHIAGLRADINAEWLSLEAHNGWQAIMTGPAIAPVIVAAIAACHGSVALIEHPAIEVLRSASSRE
jgi:hypothetical protein